MTLVQYEWAIRCDDAPFWTHWVESPQLLSPAAQSPRRTLHDFLSRRESTATVARELAQAHLAAFTSGPPYRQSNAFGRARVSDRSRVLPIAVAVSPR